MLNLGTTTQRANKLHRCENCGGRIAPGEIYVRARIVDGGDAWVWKSHTHCQRASEILFAAGIEGEDGCLPLVLDCDADDRALVAEKDPECAMAVWAEDARHG